MQLIVANWKMNGTLAAAQGWLEEMGAKPLPLAAKLVLCPPFTLIDALRQPAARLGIALGAQDLHHEASGAFTGCISALQVKDAGADYVILGHSERRQLCGETSVIVAAKAERAAAEGLHPIICVGETLEERESGKAESAVARQIAESLPQTRGEAQPFTIAYEPVWAIGTGKTPTADDIAAMHAHIQATLTALRGEGVAERTLILYGGSVKPENAKEILSLPGVGGALVGGASLSAEAFGGIAAAV